MLDDEGSAERVERCGCEEAVALRAEREVYRKALEGCVPALIRLGDFIGNEDKGANGMPGFDRCAILLAARAALATCRVQGDPK